MRPKKPKQNTSFVILTIAAIVLSGCNITSRLSEVGDGPKLSKITNPTVMPDYRPVSLPMPAPKTAEHNPNSLWRAGAKAFFKDHRAKSVGDILTVQLRLADKANLANSTTRERDDSEDTDVTNFLGLEGEFAKVLPQGINPASVLSFGSKSETTGEGSIGRSETVELTFAAVVTQILPNGALAIIGRQEVQVNKELRELMVTGVIRPEDIESDNTISHDKIAEMRVAYGGRGTLSGLQGPRWGAEVWDILFPF